MLDLLKKTEVILETMRSFLDNQGPSAKLRRMDNGASQLEHMDGHLDLRSLPEPRSGMNTWTVSSVYLTAGRRTSISESSCLTKQPVGVQEPVHISSSPINLPSTISRMPSSMAISTQLQETFPILVDRQVVEEEPLSQSGREIGVASDGTQGEDVHMTPTPAGTSTVVETVEERTQNLIAQRTSRTEALLLSKPKYLCYNYYSLDTPYTKPTTVQWSEFAAPLPDVPTEEYNNPIYSNPDLFRIVTPLKVDVFERYLESHPNQPFVQSVLRSLQEGFWPYTKPVPP
ncbi:hypothetical protein H0H87_008649, partial [Tephrocybe sp. NHM501043]